jgi:amino acid transporter/nucleotide-binding universal stress UspA family protein
MNTSSQGPSGGSGGVGSRLGRAAKVIIISSVMFTFISYWRTAAVVLCDLASTAYYIGGAVENAIGPAAPWFILAVMLFSYAVRSVYIESCSLFVRGGVYRVVKSAMGGFLAKLSVSALMFDYILTGPTSGVSAGQYIMGLIFRFVQLYAPGTYTALGLGNDDFRGALVNWGAVLLACGVTLYFFRLNIIGIHESSDKALKIMIATTIMAVVILAWCGITLAVKGPANRVPLKPDLDPKVDYKVIDVPPGDTILPDGGTRWVKDPETGKLVPKRADQGDLKAAIAIALQGQPLAAVACTSYFLTPIEPEPKMSDPMNEVGITAREDPLGFAGRWFPESLINQIRNPHSWLSILGVIGLLIAFGHSILAMSGEETLAQVYREVESPKLLNFKRAAFIVFVYSLVLTAGISFMAVLIIPNEVRMKEYSGNLIGGLSRYMVGPATLKLFLEAFVVIVGFLILAGAVNTAIIGSNGVLNRVSEDGVLPDWFLKPHPRYGTTYRLLYLITGLQLAVILLSRGNMLVLTEAYAFGVVWSFVFKALAMVVLRFRDRSPREFKVPLNIRIKGVEFPIGLSLIFLVLLMTALLNFFTKEVATVGGVSFTIIFLIVFSLSEHFHEKRLRGAHHHHLEQFNQASAGELTPQSLALSKPYHKLVAIRSTQNLFMLEKALAETDPETTSVVVMTAKVMPPMGTTIAPYDQGQLDAYDQQLMTAVVDRAEKAGKEVKPLIVPTNNPLHAVLNTAKDLQANELILGGSNKYTADEQMEQIAFYWISLHGGNPAPLTVRILSRERDLYLDLAGGSRIPKISERQARSVAELRAAGVGVDRVLLLHDGSQASSDLFQAVLTMLDPQVVLTVVPVPPAASEQPQPAAATGTLSQDEERARKLGRALQVLAMGSDGPSIVNRARQDQYDLIIVPLPVETPSDVIAVLDERAKYLIRHAHCRVLLATTPGIPQEVVDQTPSVP